MMQGEETQAKDQQQLEHDHIGNAEISELPSQSGFYGRVRELAERFASTRLGQFVIVRADRALKLLEDTTKWSLPQEKSSSAAVLERPLPWIPFLLLIVLLRLARIWLSLGALMIGNGPISPRDSIYFIQTRRRKLRAIRLHGLRVMRHRQQESSMRRVGKGFSQQLSLWLSRAICRPGVHQQEPQQQQQVFQQSVSKRPRDEETQLEQNLTIDEILNSYANVNSEDDSDFVPNPEDESESSASDSDSESRSSDDISSSEVQEIAEERIVKNGLQKPSEQQQHQQSKLDKTKTMSTNGNGNADADADDLREQKEVVAATQKEPITEDWKRGSDLLSSKLNTRLSINNTAAAAIPDQFNLNSSPHSNPNPVTPTDNNDNDNNDDSDTDSGSAKTVCTVDQPEINPILSIQPQTLPSVETLTPATSSEDIFYSPIGSPTYFNTGFLPNTPLQNVTIISAATHSTPNSELEEELKADNDIEEAARQNISHARQGLIETELDKQQEQQPHQQHQQQQHPQQQQQQPMKQQQQHHQQQRKFNHSHQRFRGRNLR